MGLSVSVPLCFLIWVSISVFKFGKFSAIISSNIFSIPFLSLLCFWDPYNMFISMFDVVPRSLKLNLCNIFCLFLSSSFHYSVFCTTMSSSVSPILFSITSSVFFILVSISFSSHDSYIFQFFVDILTGFVFSFLKSLPFITVSLNSIR